MGFPTANLAADEQLIPGEGVYAGFAQVDGRAYKAAISIGRTPTFDGRKVCVEAHLLDFDGDLYGQRVSISFVRRLRAQVKFPSKEALMEQLKRDVEEARATPASHDESGVDGSSGTHPADKEGRT